MKKYKVILFEDEFYWLLSKLDRELHDYISSHHTIHWYFLEDIIIKFRKVDK